MYNNKHRIILVYNLLYANEMMLYSYFIVRIYFSCMDINIYIYYSFI